MNLLGALLNWLMRPPDFPVMRWSNETHVGIDEEDR